MSPDYSTMFWIHSDECETQRPAIVFLNSYQGPIEEEVRVIFLDENHTNFIKSDPV